MPGYSIEEAELGDIYRKLCSDILLYGKDRLVRGYETKEFVGAHIVLTNPRLSLITTLERNLNKAFQVAEMIWILSGNDDLNTIAYYNKNMRKFSDDGKVLAGAYGPRIKPQLKYALKCLRDDPGSRQAVISIWTPNPAPSKDIPCTVMMQLIRSGDKLDMIVYMRSNDIYLGLPYDISTFTMIQLLFAHELRLEPGVYHHMVGSLHAYMNDHEKISTIAQAKSYTDSWPFIGDSGFGMLALIDQLKLMEKDIRVHGDSRYLWLKSPFMMYCANTLKAWRDKKYADSLK